MLIAFFKEKNGLLFQENCDAELDRQDKTGKFRSERSKKAAEIRWNKNKGLNAISMPEVMLQECLAMPELRVESKDIEDTNVKGTDYRRPYVAQVANILFSPFASSSPARVIEA